MLGTLLFVSFDASQGHIPLFKLHFNLSQMNLNLNTLESEEVYLLGYDAVQSCRNALAYLPYSETIKEGLRDHHAVYHLYRC
jgi:hypothetical protein